VNANIALIREHRGKWIGVDPKAGSVIAADVDYHTFSARVEEWMTANDRGAWTFYADEIVGREDS
jgi:hypothetical protein